MCPELCKNLNSVLCKNLNRDTYKLLDNTHSYHTRRKQSKNQRWSQGRKARGQGQGHKKIRGQGQPFRKETLSRPRKGMLEAKAKDQGHRCNCTPKKGFQKIFSGNLQTATKNKVIKKTFSSDLQTTLKKQGLQNFFSGEKGLQNFVSGDLQLRKTKQGLRKFSARFLAFSNKISTVQKTVLSSSRGQGNFRGLGASRPRTSKCVLEDVLEDSTSGKSYFIPQVETTQSQNSLIYIA